MKEKEYSLSNRTKIITLTVPGHCECGNHIAVDTFCVRREQEHYHLCEEHLFNNTILPARTIKELKNIRIIELLEK